MRRRVDLPNRPVVELRGVDRAGIEALSRREREVLGLAASGYLDKEIVAQLGVSPNTLRTYWARIRGKIGEVSRIALAVAYATESSTHAADEAVGADWEVDIERWTYRRLSQKPPFVEVEVGEEIEFENAIAVVHPEDVPNLRRHIEAIRTGSQSKYTFKLRVVTPLGINATRSFVRIDRDEAGRAYRMTGTRTRSVDLPHSGRLRVEVGSWERDLRSEHFTADAGYCAIFGIDPTEPNLREAALERFHSDERILTTTLITSTVAAHQRRARTTHQLHQKDGSYRWITTDLRIEYEAQRAARALGVVMAFDHD